MFFISSLLILPVSAAQMMQRPVRGKTAGPTATKASPERAKTFHRATPKSLLVVKKIFITPSKPRVGDKVAIHALVVNNGPETVKGVKLAFYLNKKQIAWQMYDIKSRNTQEFRGFFTQTQAPRAGPYTVSVLIDPNRTLERTVYKGNSASLKITILPPAVKMTRRTVGPSTLTPKSKKRRTAVGPGRAVSRQKRTPSDNPEVKTGMKTRVPARRIAPTPPGQIHTVTVKVLTRSRMPSSRIRRGENIHALEIRWARKGVLPNRVDIFLHPYRHSGKELCLKRNAANNGRATLPVPGKARAGQRYIVRVQTHDGKVHGDSKSFSLSPETPVKAAGHPQAVTAARRAKGGGVAATPINIPRPIKPVSRGRTRKNPERKITETPRTRIVRMNRPGAKRDLSAFSNNVSLPYHSLPVFTVISPNYNDDWINEKSYAIKWLILGDASPETNIGNHTITFPRNWDLFEITLLDTLNKKITTIFSSKAAPIPSTGSVTWTVPPPSKVEAGKYHIHIKAVRIVHHKKKTFSADSRVFHIGRHAFRKMKAIPANNQSFPTFPNTDRHFYVDTRPADGTRFTITRIEYPVAGGKMSVHIHVDNAPEPFKFIEEKKTQTLFFYFSNAVYQASNNPQKLGAIHAVIVGKEYIRNQASPLLFPQYELPKGSSDYKIEFTPKLSQPLTTLIVEQKDNQGTYDKCRTFFYPRLEVRLSSYSKTDMDIDTRPWIGYLNNLTKKKGIVKKGDLTGTSGLKTKTIKVSKTCKGNYGNESIEW